MTKCSWCNKDFKEFGKMYSHFINENMTCMLFEVLCPNCGDGPINPKFLIPDTFIGYPCTIHYGCGRKIEYDGKIFTNISLCQHKIEPRCVCANYSLSHDDGCAWQAWNKENDGLKR